MANDYVKAQSHVLSSLGHSLVNVSSADTQALLSEASQRISQHRERAADILARLHQLNPTIARRFRAKEDVLDALQLRLIRSPPPPPATSPSFSSYIIVSYCWHYTVWPLAAAAQPVAPGWEISRPMADAVMGLRTDEGEGVWLDKMCINQADPVDKKIHIGAMDMIYRSARRVIILLEDVQLSLEEERAGSAYASFYEDMCQEVKEKSLEGGEKLAFIDEYFPRREQAAQAAGHKDIEAAGKQFAMRVLQARWFSRAWCAHECRAVRHEKINNPLILCFAPDGSVKRFEIRFMHYLALYLSDKESEGPTPAPIVAAQFNDPNPRTLKQLWWRIQRLMPERSSNISAMQHLVSILGLGCAKLEDLMSIALNTSEIPLYYVGDGPVPWADTVWIFALLVLASRDAVPLILEGSKLLMPGDGHREVVSWAPRPTEAVLEDVLPIPSDECITGVTAEYIELDLMVFASGPGKPSETALESASRIVEEHGLKDFAHGLGEAANEAVQRTTNVMKYGMHKAVGHDGPLKNFVQFWISYAIDCGLEWAVRFPKVLKAESEGVWQHGTLGEPSYPQLRDAAKALLDCLLPSPDDSSEDSQQRHIEGLVRFLSCVVDPRLPFVTANPRCLPCTNGDFAFTQSISNRSWVAVPVAIWNVPFGMRRAWIVEPFNPADEPENPQDHLPDLSKKPEADAMAVDVYPVLSCDLPDQRAPRNKEGTWRLRARQEMFGCEPSKWYTTSREDEGMPMMLLKRQRVYGSLDYDWQAISTAARAYEEKYITT